MNIRKRANFVNGYLMHASCSGWDQGKELPTVSLL